MLQNSPIQRQCVIQNHNGQPIIMRCTQPECQQPVRWMCWKCKHLHGDHLQLCLLFEELALFLQGNKGVYVYKQRQQLQKQILQELSHQKILVLTCFQSLQTLYVDSFEALEKEEKAIMAFYSRIEATNPFQLTEEDFIAFQTKQNHQEARIYQENQLKIYSEIKSCNGQIVQITQSLQELVAFKIKHGKIIELFDQSKSDNYKAVGNYRFGIKQGQWTIINHKEESMYTFDKFSGGGYYNSSGNKHGEWVDIELGESMKQHYYVKHIGKYEDGKRIDQWETQDLTGETQLSGGGQYNSYGTKHGSWVDVEIGISWNQLKYVQHIGKYNNGKRIDQWMIKDSKGKRIGTGQYNQSGSKHGQWVDVDISKTESQHEYFHYIGKYNDGKKIDQWEIKDYQGKRIGGGQYNSFGLRHGQWVNVEIDISWDEHKYVLHIGKYADGKKIEQWEINDLQGKSLYRVTYNLDGVRIE